MSNDNQAKIYAFIGATGCGKTTAMLKMLAKPKRRRVLVWSPKEAIDNYAEKFGAVVVSSVSDLLEVMKRAGSGKFAVVFKPSINRKAAERQFDVVARAVMLARDVTFIAEELHTVTRPSWCPDGWSELVMMGRGYGAEIFGCSQRPASMDKDFLGSCSIIRVGRLPYSEDQKACAKSLNVPVQEVAALTGYEFIARNMLSGEMMRG